MGFNVKRINYANVLTVFFNMLFALKYAFENNPLILLDIGVFIILIGNVLRII